MPLFKCSKCHHEFESIFPEAICDWCGKPGKVIQEQTDLEKFAKDFINKEIYHEPLPRKKE